MSPAKASSEKSSGLPPGPNPHANDPLHVAPFGKAWALVEGLGVITTHRTREEASVALADTLHRRIVVALTSYPPDMIGARKHWSMLRELARAEIAREGKPLQ